MRCWFLFMFTTTPTPTDFTESGNTPENLVTPRTGIPDFFRCYQIFGGVTKMNLVMGVIFTFVRIHGKQIGNVTKKTGNGTSGGTGGTSYRPRSRL